MQVPPAAASADIVEAADLSHFAAVEELQRAVWGSRAPVVGVPQLVAAAHTGGVVLLARDAGRPVGFCYGFVGLDAGGRPLVAGSEPEVILWSHMLAVVGSHRRQGLGARLKLAQAEMARRRGMRRILWTFDPLEARNARLNLHRLGAVAARYSVNRYGVLTDDLNAGLETDRLIADWWVGTAGTNRPAEPGGRQLTVNPDAPHGGVRGAEDLAGHDGPVRITVPVAGWRDDPRLVARWRTNVRAAFLTAFASGFVAVDVDLDERAGRYRLVRGGDDTESPMRAEPMSGEDR